jgi:hypothetical protein
MYGGFADGMVDESLRAQTLSMLRSSATLSKMRLKRGTTEGQEWRMRDDLDPDTYGAMLAAHWAQRATKYKMDYDRFVTQHADRPRDRSSVPNYSVGTRGLPFIGQTVTDGRYRGSGLY